MKSLKNKGRWPGALSLHEPNSDCITASRFFKDSPSQDEKVANSELGATDFDAGIQSRNVKKKRTSIQRAQTVRD
jgi:hypothetical protein